MCGNSWVSWALKQWQDIGKTFTGQKQQFNTDGEPGLQQGKMDLRQNPTHKSKSTEQADYYMIQ